MFSSVSAFARLDDPDSAPPENYSKSQAVRAWLVYTALASNNLPMRPDLRASQKYAFRRVFEGLRRGLITLDFAPADEAVVEIPPINHPHYMQAMLYWCVRLDCNLSVLSEAYAQLGRAAPFEQMRVAAKRVQGEEKRARKVNKGWLRTEGHSSGPAATMPMFRL